MRANKEATTCPQVASLDADGVCEILQELFSYCDGNLIWRERDLKFFTSEWSWRVWNAKHAGKRAGRKKDRYWVVSIFSRKYFCHRVIFAMHYGYFPSGFIDHIDGDTDNNRIQNLREVSPRDNCRNSAIPKDNKSGHIGVRQKKESRVYIAYIYDGGRQQHLGSFISMDEAAKARKAAEKRLGYHANHGRSS